MGISILLLATVAAVTDGADGSPGHTLPDGNAQDITSNFLGKILRIDPFGDDFTGAADPTNIKNYAIPPTNPMKAGVGDSSDDVGDDEIWAYGVRNPFRDSFDRTTGDLWIGDVGQSSREEIDHEAASSTGAKNFGCAHGKARSKHRREAGLC